MSQKQDYRDRIIRLHKEGKLEMLGEILLDPKDEEVVISFPGSNQLILLTDDFLSRLRQAIMPQDDPTVRVLAARLWLIQASQHLRDAKESLEMQEEKAQKQAEK